MAFRDTMDQLQPLRLRDLKLQARLLFKQGQKDDSVAFRFSNLPPFKNLSLNEIKESIRLKHAYELTATQYGYTNWRSLKQYVVEQDSLYRNQCVAFVYAWFKDYDQAKNYQEKNNGYLLRFWSDYIVCGDEYIRCIGMPVGHQDWGFIGYDWVKPKNRRAYERLKGLAIKNYLLINH